MLQTETDRGPLQVKRGEWLEAMARKAGFIGPAALAAELRVSRQAVAAWFKGGPIRQQPTLDRLAEVLGVSPGQILAGPYTMAHNSVNRPVNDGGKEDRTTLARRAARLVEDAILSGTPDSLVLLADWMIRLADELGRIHPGFDANEMRATADQIRRMAG